MRTIIAYCIPSLHNVGGMERIITFKANYFAEQFNFDVYIILTDGKEKEPCYNLSNNVTVINLDVNFNDLYGKPLWNRVFLYLWKQFIYRRRLTDCLKKIKADITISTLRREINFIGSINDGSLKIGEIHFCRENYRDFKLEKLPGFAKRIFKYLWMRQLISNIRKLDKFVVLTNEDKQKWNEIDQNKIMTIYNPVSSSSQQFSSCENKRVIAAGRYSLEKGFDLLTEAWKYVNEKHPDWTLHIYGDGDRTDLEKRINRLKLTNSFIANGKTNAITEKYLESSIFVLSSRWEGMPLVLIEAMSLGVAPVSFACPSGPRDIITHGIDGLLVENGNIEMLAENICYLIENEEKRKEMGRNARESVKRFDAKVIMSQWKELFEMLIIEKS